MVLRGGHFEAIGSHALIFQIRGGMQYNLSVWDARLIAADAGGLPFFSARTFKTAVAMGVCSSWIRSKRPTMPAWMPFCHDTR
jgi:hypothetical protein